MCGGRAISGPLCPWAKARPLRACGGIEALTGQAALDYLRAQDARLAEVAAVLKASPAEVVERVKALAEERRALQNEVAQLRRELAMGGKAGGPEMQGSRRREADRAGADRRVGQGSAGAD